MTGGIAQMLPSAMADGRRRTAGLFCAAYSVISIRRKVKPMPVSPNALLVSDSAGTETRLLAANTAVWS